MDSKTPSGEDGDGLRRSNRPRVARTRFTPDSPISSKKAAKNKAQDDSDASFAAPSEASSSRKRAKKRKAQDDSDASFNMSSSSTFSSLIDDSDESFVWPSVRPYKKTKTRPGNIRRIPLG